MTHVEYFEIAKQQLWKVNECSTGAECWCRIITTEEPIYTNDDEQLNITGWGSISKEFAEYIVKIHNENLLII